MFKIQEIRDKGAAAVVSGRHILKAASMIQAKRGSAITLDRRKPVNFAGDSYGVPKAEYRRLIGPVGYIRQDQQADG